MFTNNKSRSYLWR